MSTTAHTAPSRGAILFVGSWAHTVLQIAVVGVLARTLAPESFGAFAVALVIVRLAGTAGQLGAGAAIVQLRVLHEAHARAAFFLAVAGSCALAAALWMGAPAVGALVGVDEVAALLRGMAVAVPLSAVGAIPLGLLEREQRFARVAVVEPFAYLLAFAPVAIALAWSGHGAMALAAAHVCRTALASVLARALRPHALAPSRDRGAWRAVWSVGPGLMMSRLAASVARELDVFVVGRLFGGAALGFYSRATRMTTTPVNTSAAVLGRLLFTKLARAQDDPARLLDGYRAALALTLLLTAPFAAALAVLADDVVLVLLGARFAEAGPITRVLATVTPLVAAHQVSLALLHATGRGGESAWRSALHAVIVVIGTLALYALGMPVLGAALALWTAEAVRTLVTIPRCAAACGASPTAIVGAFRPALIAAALAAAVAFAARSGLLATLHASPSPTDGAAWAAVVVVVAGGAGVASAWLACLLFPRAVCGPLASGALVSLLGTAPPWLRARTARLEERLRRATTMATTTATGPRTAA